MGRKWNIFLCRWLTMVIDYIIIYIPCKYTFSQLNYIIYISSCPNLFYIFYYPPTIIFYYSKNFLCTVLKISKHPCSFCAVRHGMLFLPTLFSTTEKNPITDISTSNEVLIPYIYTTIHISAVRSYHCLFRRYAP